MSVNAILLNASVAHALFTNRFSQHVANRYVAHLNALDGELVAKLEAALGRLPDSAIRVAMIEQQLAQVREINRQAYDAAHNDMMVNLKGMTEVETAFAANLFTNVIGITPMQVDANAIFSALQAEPFHGRVLSEWSSMQEADRMARLTDAVARGMSLSETNDEIIRRIRGTRAENYADGILNVPRHNAAALAQTAVAHTANFARMEYIEANTEFIKGWRFVATLDSRTSPYCREHDGRFYKTGEGVPPPIHFNCRSTAVPVVKSPQEMGYNLPDYQPEERASADGPVDANLTYKEWFSQQSPDVQDVVLGKAKGQLYREGGLPIERFSDGQGRALTLKELREIDAEMFDAILKKK